MRTIKELQQRLKPSNTFQARYNIEPDDKVHLLYVSPTLNATGYYRMIAPALEINKSQSHKAIITSIEKNDFSRKLSDFVNQLDERLITWADYIIFPALFSDMAYLLQAIKTLNPQVQLVMDVDRNYFALPVSIPLSLKLTQERLNSFETNLGLMDMATVANKSFHKFLQKLTADRLPDSNVLVEFSPSLTSRFGYEETPRLIKNDTEKIRIGIIKPTEEDLLSLKEILIKTRSTLKKNIQFVCLGKPHSTKEGDLLLKEVDCEIHNSVSFTGYFEKLNSLMLDVVLLPAKERLYNRHQSIQSFLELSALGIPVIASIHHPAAKFIVDSETGFVASEIPEWIDIISTILNQDVEYRSRLSSFIVKSVWKNHSYSQTNMEYLLDSFI